MPGLGALVEFAKVAGPIGLALLVVGIAIWAMVTLVKHFQATTALELKGLAEAVRDTAHGASRREERVLDVVERNATALERMATASTDQAEAGRDLAREMAHLRQNDQQREEEYRQHFLEVIRAIRGGESRG